MRSRLPLDHRRLLVGPVRAADNARRYYPFGPAPAGMGGRYAMLPFGLLGFVLVLAVTLVYVVVIRGPDTHGNLWNEVRPGYERTEVSYVLPELPPPMSSLATVSTALPGGPAEPGTAPATPPATTPPAEVSFARDVLPVLKANCAACHGPALALHSLNITTYQSIIDTGTDEVLVVPGSPEDSLLLKMMRGRGTMPMPPLGLLPDEQVKVVEDWISQGAKDN